MKKLTCIVCPIGCSLNVDDSLGLDNLKVNGNRCARGAEYAIEEIRAPKRAVTATVAILESQLNDSSSCRRIPVKTTAPCLLEKIPALLNDIYQIKVSLPIKMGDVLINNWNDEGIDVVTTRSLDNEK